MDLLAYFSLRRIPETNGFLPLKPNSSRTLLISAASIDPLPS
jgi:hypothetical protein